MDISYVKTLVEGLKSTSSRCLLETVIKIRNDIAVTDQGIQLFRECNGYDYLVLLLRKPNEKILDVTLSILGNCCLEEYSSLAVNKLNIHGSLVSLLKTLSKDSILGRTCRVIGNLAQQNCNVEAFHNNGAVIALMGVIETRDDNTSYPTLTMAVRAIRQLWMSLDKRKEMLAQNAVYCITMLMIKECESAGIIKSTNTAKENHGLRKSQEELINGILKCLGYFTTYSTIQCTEQIQGDGRGYQCLVALTKVYESHALKCLFNLCYTSSCRPLLGTAGFVECLVGILQKHSEVVLWPEGAARALAHLSGESVNRSRLRHSGGLVLLMAAARVSPEALHALLQYIFDESTLQVLVSEGLISFLTEELTKYVSTMDVEHNYRETKDIIQVSGLPDKSRGMSKVEDNASDEIKNNTKEKDKVLKRKKQGLRELINEGELNVVIERDNMLVGFVASNESDASDDSLIENGEQILNKMGLKRNKCSSKIRKKPKLIKMVNKDWSADVYWEPKSPEWLNQSTSHCSKSQRSPERGVLNPWSQFVEGNHRGMSPPYMSPVPLNKVAQDWNSDSGVSVHEKNIASPLSTDSGWSPSSSGTSTSPYSGEESSDSELSGRYSPVCSEAEDEGCIAVAAVVAAESEDSTAERVVTQFTHNLHELIDDDKCIDDDTHVKDETYNTESDVKVGRIACVLVLLCRVAYAAEIIYTQEMFSEPDCLSSVLDYLERCKRPLGRAARILVKLFSNSLCLLGVLKNRIPLKLYNMSVNSRHQTTQCSQCEQVARLCTNMLYQLTLTSECGFGDGQICNQLLTGDSEMKQTISLMLPYLVESAKPLKKYFIDCGALDMLFDVISESREKIEDCVPGLSKLAINVNIKDPKSLENRFKGHISLNYDPILDNLSVDDIVTFALDDLSTVKANKVFLCQGSDFFSAMLMGHFKESVEKCVQLKKVTKPALEYLITLLHHDLNNPKCNIQTFPLSEKLETNLEALLLADRFLFDTLKVSLCSAILQFQLTPETANKIYVWSLNEGMGYLCVESVAYLLTGKMSDTQRIHSFRSILELEYKEQYLDDVKSLILRQLVKQYNRI